MNTELAEIVQYRLQPPAYQREAGTAYSFEMNTLLGKSIQLRFAGQINCTRCGRKTSKAFGEGYCYPCFTSAPENAPCIVRPELCEAHLGKGRDVAWEETHHNQPHVVYLALSSEVKVGVTRITNIPTRWIDQGASQVIVLAEVPYRQLAGEIEVSLKSHFTDKTAWQKMLKNEVATGIQLLSEKDRAGRLLYEPLQEYISDNDEIITISYPALSYPTKVSSLSFDKTPEISGKLIAIKGQYLIFEGGNALNIRRHEGYFIEISD